MQCIGLIVLLLPGFTLTVAMSELATQNYLAGTGRLAGAFILMLLMGAGVAIGTTLGTEWLPVRPFWPNNILKSRAKLIRRSFTRAPTICCAYVA